ncbi:MAG: hypothetical protein ABI666_02560 [Ferruginibacter sp.]
MANTDLTEIQLNGEKQVELWLSSNGYNPISKETLQPGESGLKAMGSVENILIQVRTFLHPHRPFKLSEFEVDRLTRRAAKLKLVAYAAYIVLNEKNELAEDITWERLT